MVKRISTGSPFEATFGYSRAVVDGDRVHVSGTTGYDYATMKMPESVGEQARKSAGVDEENPCAAPDVAAFDGLR